MRKRIFRFMSLVILLCVSLLLLLWGVGLRNEFDTQIRQGLETIRVSLITETGEVIYDSAEGKTLDNHKERPEVLEAMQKGYGESQRHSETFGGEAYYYAVKIADGDILRLALSGRSVSELLRQFVPTILLCIGIVLVIALLSARWFTDKIISPITELHDDGKDKRGFHDAYDELVPFVKTIEKQQEAIIGHCADLEDQAAMTRAITESMKEGLILVDGNGRIRSLNRSALEIFQVENVNNTDLRYLCRNRDFLDAARKCLAGVNTEIRFDRHNTTYTVYMHPVYGCDQIKGAVILLLDTTEKRKAEEQRREFSANVSHELKTPLTAISALAEMIATDLADKEDIKDFALRISGQVRRLINIIDDVIRLSEFDECKVDSASSSFDVRELAQAVLTSLKEKADERRITLELHGERMFLTANERMIDELLYNLVDNAIKYNTDNGSVTVTLAERDGGHVISVSDTGMGIPEEQQSRVFERFYRADQARSQRISGTGLGLSIVKHIIEHHAGRLTLESSQQGTTITCWFKAP